MLEEICVVLTTDDVLQTLASVDVYDEEIICVLLFIELGRFSLFVGCSELSGGCSEPSSGWSEPSWGLSEPSWGWSEPSWGWSEPSWGWSEPPEIEPST